MQNLSWWWYYLDQIWDDKGVHSFSKDISPNIIVIARPEFELTYYVRMYIRIFSYLPTPPLGQDMTQGQFLSGV